MSALDEEKSCEKVFGFFPKFSKKNIAKNGSKWHNSARKAKKLEKIFQSIWEKAKNKFHKTSAQVSFIHFPI